MCSFGRQLAPASAALCAIPGAGPAVHADLLLGACLTVLDLDRSVWPTRVSRTVGVFVYLALAALSRSLGVPLANHSRAAVTAGLPT